MNRIAAKRFAVGCTLVLLPSLSIGAWAQTHDIEVKRGKVVYVTGNDLVVKTEDGSLKHFVVPSDSRFNVDGKQIAVQDLRPGTELTQTITTTTEDRLVTNVRAVDVKVIESKPPFLTVASGDKIKHLKVPEGATFTIDGKELKLADLRQGMRLKGTVVMTTPTTVVSRARSVNGRDPAVPKPVATPVLLGVLLFEEVDLP